LCQVVQEDKGEITCKGLETVDGICPENKVPTLDKKNYEIWSMFQLMMPGLNRQDGYDYNAIQVVFDVYGIENRKRLEKLTLITKLIHVIDVEKKARSKKGGA